MIIKKITALFVCVLFALAAFSGCANQTKQADNGKINVVTTIFPEYDMARAITDGNANLYMLTKPGASVHSFDPTPQDIITIQNADIFIYVGGESDAWVENMLASIDTSEIIVLCMMDYVETFEEEIKEGMEEEIEEEDPGHEENEGHVAEHDEHIWSSPKNAVKLIDVICSAVCEADPENADVYQSNAKAYQDELNAVDEELTNIVKNAKRKKIVVADKFPFLYFVKAYGLDYAAAFPGCSDQADASAKTIAYLVNYVKDEKLPYVYYVELSNQNVAGAICEQTGAEMLLLNSCHNISKTDFEDGITYVDLMRQNAQNLEKGLNE